MDYRKLISFGKNSFVISLPKAWVKKYHLSKGDTIYVDEQDNKLIVSPERLSYDTETSLTIEVDGKDVDRIKREIVGAYVNNYKQIILEGHDVKRFAKELHSCISRLVALEVMEQTSTRIVTKDFLNLQDVSVESMVRKIDVVIRSMWEDCLHMFSEDNYENIYFRDGDVNRLTFLLFRIIRYGLSNGMYASRSLKLTSVDLLNLWVFGMYLEAAADEVKRIARYMGRVKLSAKEQKTYLEQLREIRELYFIAVKGHYEKDSSLLHPLPPACETHVAWADKFLARNKDVENIGFLIGHTKVLISHIKHMSRILY